MTVTTDEPAGTTQQVTQSLTFQPSTVTHETSASSRPMIIESPSATTNASGSNIGVVGGALGAGVVILVIISAISCGGICLLVKSHSTDGVPVERRAEKDPSTHLSLSEENLTPHIPMSTNESYATTLSPNQAYDFINTDEQLYYSINGEENVSIIRTWQAYGSPNPDEQIYDYIDEKENDFNIKTEKNDAYISTPHITLNTNESYATVVPPTPNDPCKDEEEEELYI